MLRLSRLPLPLRRLAWAIGLNLGRQHANYAGSFGITSVSAFGPGTLHALSPGPYLISYGQLEPDGRMEVVIRWDHRVTDAAMIAKTLTRLEAVLNGEIAAELRAGSATAGAEIRPMVRRPDDRLVRVPAGSGRPLGLSKPSCRDGPHAIRHPGPERLEPPCFAGRFGPRCVSRPVVLPLSFKDGPVGTGLWPGAQEGAFPHPYQHVRGRDDKAQ